MSLEENKEISQNKEEEEKNNNDELPESKNKSLMNGKIDTTESFNKVKIFKPKAVRLCPPRRKKLNQPTKQNKKGFKLKDKSKKKLTNLDDISIEEINKDFKIYKDNMEEEHCHNELLNIINNSCENKNGENNQKIKR